VSELRKIIDREIELSYEESARLPKVKSNSKEVSTAFARGYFAGERWVYAYLRNHPKLRRLMK
jgi:hypothetical protein